VIIGFYQLARAPEAVVPTLVMKARAAGHRLLLRCADAALLARLDDLLWSVPPATSFLAHGLAARLPVERRSGQPILLDNGWPAANAADMLMQIGDDLPEGLEGLARVAFLFGEADLETARARWRAVKATPGLEPVYWRESEGGRFEKAG
jgi:DNA polymerase-3 subunit chi